MPIKIKDTLSVWYEHYNKVCSFVEEHNRLPEFHNNESDESKLGNWLRRMRSDQRTPLTDEQKKKLESIPGWYWNIKDVNEIRWMENYQKVKAYYTDGLIPVKSSTNEEEKKLGEWCVSQRKAYKSKKISDKRVFLLEEIPEWNWGFSQEILWNDKFQRVKEFIEKEGRMPSRLSCINNDDKYNERTLAFWCDDQKRNSKISDDRKEKLMSIAFYEK